MMNTFFEYLFDPIKLITLVGLVGVTLIIFVETGLLFGFFLPGDSLLITAGLFAARGDIQISHLIVGTLSAAILGDATGYFIGKRLGSLLYAKDDSFFFRKKHLYHAKNFYEKHGGKTLVFARFIPIVRTFVPTAAGAAQMKFLSFITYNIIGAGLWICSMCFGGYYLGQLMGAKISQYIHIIIISVVLLSILPLFLKWFFSRCKK